MQAKAIVIRDSEISELGWKNLQKSSNKMNHDLKLSRFDAITQSEVNDTLLMFGVKWNYPWNGPLLDYASGLLKTPYKTRVREARIAAALSHYTLWKMVCEYNEPTLILEHDALFIKPIDFDVNDFTFDILGINNPMGATRKASVFNEKVRKSSDRFIQVPYVDDDIKVPQGLAGNSAYIIKPEGAKKAMKLVRKYGLWPNDAILNRQLMPNIGVSTTYYTKIQGLESTTT